VTSWEATLAVGDAPSLELSADLTSLHVIEAKGGFQGLDDDGKAEIRRSIDKVRSSRIQSSEGMLKLSGDLKLGGTTKPISFQLHERNGTLTGAVTLRPSNWGIKPYSALFGALKVNDEVTVSVEARLNATTGAG
jgi:hypothetical protein